MIGVPNEENSQLTELPFEEKELDYHYLFKTMATGVVCYDRDRKVIFANPAAEQILGQTLDQMKCSAFAGKPERTIHEDGSDFPEEIHPSMEALRTGKPVRDVVVGVFHPEKEEYRWIIVNAIPQFKPGEDRPYQVFCTFHEVTKLKQAEEKMRKSEELFRNFLETIQLAGIMLDVRGNITFCNDYLLKLTGWKHEEVLGKSWFKIFLPSEIRDKIYQSVFKKGLETSQFPAYYENEIIARSGEHRIIAWNNTAIRDTAGRIIGTASVGGDVTERRNMEETLRISAQKWQTTFDAINDCICIIDFEGRILQCNKAMIDLIGKPSCEIINNFCWKLIHNTSEPIEGCPVIRMQKTHTRESLLLPLGDRWFHVVADPLLNDNGDMLGAVHILSDITERKRAEQMLIDKNRELNDFTYRVSHDLKGSINIIRGYSEAIKDDPELFDTYFDRILRRIDHLTIFINKLLKLSQAGKILGKREMVEMDSLIRNVFYSSKPKGVSADLIINDALPNVFGDPLSIEHLFSNLIDNSIKYRDIEKEKLTIEIRHGLESRNIIIFFKDNGSGIEEKYLDKIFNPGFALNKNRETGFGLSIVKKIVDAHGGNIKAKSAGKNQGLEFIIKLPIDSD